MRTLIAHRPSPAMVVACIALLVALGGTSIAAVTAIAPNSVGTAQIKASAVTAGEDQEQQRDRRRRSHRTRSPARTSGTARCRATTSRRTRSRPAPRAPPARPARRVLPAPSGRSPSARRAWSSPEGSPTTRSTRRGPSRSTATRTRRRSPPASGWSDDAADRELWTQRLTPIITNNAVTGYRGTGGNDSGNSSTFTLYVLCYVG